MLEPQGKNGVPRYSFVIPVYNERAMLANLFNALDTLMSKVGEAAEVILVDDGSRDDTATIIKDKCDADCRYRYIGLSRNFGQQIAITAGLDRARGAAIIILDADLQDPPELVPDMIARWKDGYDVVYAERIRREGESRLKRVTARLFYRVLGLTASIDVPRNVGDFRLIDRSVLEAVRGMRERDRFLRGMFAWVGFKQIGVRFHRPSRSAGETKWSISQMIAFAVNGILGFSDAPLRLVVWCGFLVSFCGILYGFYVIAMRFWRADLVPGWSSSIVVTAFLAGINMLMTGIVGLYVGRIHNEVKKRPLYVIRECIGFSSSTARGSALTDTHDSELETPSR